MEADNMEAQRAGGAGLTRSRILARDLFYKGSVKFLGCASYMDSSVV